MFRAEIRLLANGPTLKVEGRLVDNKSQWDYVLRDQRPCLLCPVTDLSDVSYVNSAGEELPKWLATRRTVCRRQCLRALRL